MRWSWTCLIGLIAAVLYAIKIPPSPDQDTSLANVAKYSGRLLTFSIQEVKDFKSGDVKVANVKVRVSGGSTSDWAATAIAIAEHIGASAAADSAIVQVDRNDVDDGNSSKPFLQLAAVFYCGTNHRSAERWAVFVTSRPSSGDNWFGSMSTMTQVRREDMAVDYDAQSADLAKVITCLRTGGCREG